MTSSGNTLPLDATDTPVGVDDIDTDIAASIAGSVAKEHPRVDEDSISASGLIARDDSTEVKTVTETKPTPTNTTKSLNESNNKIIKEIDDETPKTFPQILMAVLTNDEDSDTISWLPHGRSFIIYKKKTFATKVLVKYFKATKFTSFTRKLNRWGFTRVTRGPEMGSYFHKLFLRDNPELCLRMSSHTSSKYHHTHNDPTNPIHSNAPPIHGHIMMSPGGFPGFIPAAGMGIPMMPFPFYGMPTMQPGTAPVGMVAPLGGVPPGTIVAAKMPAVPTTTAELSQQNQYINQQLQQLQWQQFQLQQFQQQQQQQLLASQQAAASTAAVSNGNNGPGPQHQTPPPGVPPPQMVSPYPLQQLQAPTGAPGNGPSPASTLPRTTMPGTQATIQHPPAANQPGNSQHPGPAAPHPGHHYQQMPPMMNMPPSAGPHPPQQHMNYQHPHPRPGTSQHPANQNSFGHSPQYQYGQQQPQQGHSPPRPHQGGNNGANPPPMGNHAGHHPGGHPQTYSFQYPQQQQYHNPHPQHPQNPQYQQQPPTPPPPPQQPQPQQQHYNPPGHSRHMDPCLPQQPELPSLPPPSTQEQPPAVDVTNRIRESLEQGEEGNQPTVPGATEVVVKGDGELVV